MRANERTFPSMVSIPRLSSPLPLFFPTRGSSDIKRASPRGFPSRGVLFAAVISNMTFQKRGNREDLFLA